MGVHDYCCFIQKNDQCLEQYELCADGDEEQDHVHEEDGEDEEEEKGEERDNCYDNSYNIGCGNNKCVIVLVPNSVNINNMSLTDFSKFQTLHWSYSWDDWNFDDGSNNKEDGHYTEVLMLDGCYPQIDRSVWSHPDYPDHTLVNFDPIAYSAFVQHTITAHQLCYMYYYTCLSNRDKLTHNGKLQTLDKQQLYDIIDTYHRLETPNI